MNQADATLTLSLAAAAGVTLVIAGQRLKVPSIVLLLAGGAALGPECLGLIDPSTLKEGLNTVIALAVAVILFEGGLTLDVEGYRRAPVVILRLLTVGPLVTWVGTALAVSWLYGLSPGMALMCGSLVVVTGPTVISPLLRRLHIRERLHHILYWEGVLVDAVGVFLAVLCYEWLTPDLVHPLLQPIGRFALRMLVGLGLGVSIGYCVATVLARGWIPVEHVNIFVLATALLSFGVSDALMHEAGILTVVVAGLTVGLRHPPQLRHLRHFKLQLTELGIGVLFILLAAKLDLGQFVGWRLLFLLLFVMFVLRPAVILLATMGRDFELREKVFLSWVAPRGIVAAAMASLFSIRLQELGHSEAIYLETVTYAVIAATVVLQALSAPVLARMLRLERPDLRTWVLLGDPGLVAALGRGLRRAGSDVIEIPGEASTLKDLEPGDPRLASAEAVLCAGTTMLQNVWSACRSVLDVRPEACYRWATFEPDEGPSLWAGDPAGNVVWMSTVTAAAVAEGLAAGRYTIDVIDIGDDDQEGRFGESLQPLFWVHEGQARIIPDPLNPGPPKGNMVVVLKHPVLGLGDLVAHVDLVKEEGVTFEEVLARVAASAARIYPELPRESTVKDILKRRETMPTAIGGGMAIPHGYSDRVDQSRVFLAVIPKSIPDMVVPDEQPVRLVCLLISPLGNATGHLRSLAALASMAKEAEFIDLLCRQQVPDRVLRLISERG